MKLRARAQARCPRSTYRLFGYCTAFFDVGDARDQGPDDEPIVGPPPPAVKPGCTPVGFVIDGARARAYGRRACEVERGE